MESQSHVIENLKKQLRECSEDTINIKKISEIVKDNPNDSELGKKIRSFFREIKKNKESNLEKYITMIENELIMSNYNDGWLNEWFKKKLKELKEKK